VESLIDSVRQKTGQQTAQKFYSTSGNASYRLGDRALIETTVSHNTRRASSDVETPQWTTADWISWVGTARLNYQLSRRLDAAVGVELTRDEITDSPNMRTSQPYLQVTWRSTKKLSLIARGGAETRRVEGGNIDDLNNPVYSASIQYEPIETTSLSFSASRGVTASFFANQASESTTYGVNISQRLIQRLYFSAGYSSGETTYIATSLSFISNRKDEYETYNIRVSTPILRRGSVAIFAQRSHNSSNAAEFDFTSDQFGTEISYIF
jgi:hypothetical protein